MDRVIDCFRSLCAVPAVWCHGHDGLQPLLQMPVWSMGRVVSCLCSKLVWFRGSSRCLLAGSPAEVSWWIALVVLCYGTQRRPQHNCRKHVDSVSFWRVATRTRRSFSSLFPQLAAPRTACHRTRDRGSTSLMLHAPRRKFTLESPSSCSVPGLTDLQQKSRSVVGPIFYTTAVAGECRTRAQMRLSRNATWGGGALKVRLHLRGSTCRSWTIRHSTTMRLARALGLTRTCAHVCMCVSALLIRPRSVAHLQHEPFCPRRTIGACALWCCW